MSARVFTGTVFARSSATLLARVCGHDGQPVTRASIAAIVYEVWDLEASPSARVAGPTSVDVTQTMFDAPTRDVRWTRDAVGYNFRLALPASVFPLPHVHRVDLLFTPIAGAVFRAAFEINALIVHAD